MKKHLFLIGWLTLIMAIIISTIFIVGKWKSYVDSGQASAFRRNAYQGQIEGYNVEIIETDGGRGFDRTVRLRSWANPNQVSLAGYDYNDDGLWDRIFWCQYPQPQNGCNAFFFTLTGGRQWEPDSKDKDARPFTLGEILLAKQRLDTAMMTVHNESHLSSLPKNVRRGWKRVKD